NEAKRWWPLRCAQRLFDRHIHRVKLVVTRHLLGELALSSIDSGILEDDEVPKQVEETALLEDALENHLQFRQRGRCVPAPTERAPRLKPFLAGAERPDARLHAIGRDKRRVGDKQFWNLHLIGLKLLEGRPDRRILVRRILQLN